MVDKSYRLGILTVLGTLIASGATTLGYALIAGKASRGDTVVRAAEHLEANGVALRLGAFQLTERSGRPVGDTDLNDEVWVASFIFTHCPLSCPRISSVMKGLQDKLKDSPVRLVSITVDPDRDTPEVLAAYADASVPTRTAGGS